MTKRKDEQVLKDIFLNFLQEIERERYEVAGENIPNRASDLQFDYLLRAVHSKKSLALEITLLSDNEEDFIYTKLRDLVIQRLQDSMKPRLEELNGDLIIEIPHYPTGCEIRKLEAVAASILESAKTLTPGQRTEVATPIGPLEISCREGNQSLWFVSYGGFGWTNYSSDVSLMSAMLLRRLHKKNRQLDTDADRRVLLIGRMAGTINRAAIREALAPLRERFPNIEELYVCYGEQDIDRHW